MMDRDQHWLGFLNQFKKHISKVEDSITGKIQHLQLDVTDTIKNNAIKDEQIQTISEQNAKEIKIMKTSMYHLKQDFDSNFSSMQE